MSDWRVANLVWRGTVHKPVAPTALLFFSICNVCYNPKWRQKSASRQFLWRRLWQATTSTNPFTSTTVVKNWALRIIRIFCKEWYSSSIGMSTVWFRYFHPIGENERNAVDTAMHLSSVIQHKRLLSSRPIQYFGNWWLTISPTSSISQRTLDKTKRWLGRRWENFCM